MRVSDSHFASVPGGTSVNSETLVPDGETWEISEFVGSAAYVDNAEVKLCWGAELLASTHGDARIELDRQIVGDGVTKLCIVLDNAAANARSLGGQWRGRKVST